MFEENMVLFVKMYVMDRYTILVMAFDQLCSWTDIVGLNLFYKQKLAN